VSAAAALGGAGALSAYLALAAPRLRLLVVALAAQALVALALALAGRTRLLMAALGGLGGAIVTLDLVRGRSALLVVAGAAALLAIGECASLSLSLRSVELIARDALARRFAQLAIVALGGLAVAALVELATRVAVRGGLDAGLVALLAAVAVVALAGALAPAGRETRDPPQARGRARPLDRDPRAAPSLDPIDLDLHDRAQPLDPKPRASRSVAPSESTSATETGGRATRRSWAMRSPAAMSKALVRSVLSRSTRSSPR
jgi:hypothetical protein